MTDGKSPDLTPFIDALSEAISAAMRKAQRASPTEKRRSQKEIVLENWENVIAEVSGDGQFRFNERQIFYRMRPILMDATGKELSIGNFKSVITDFEPEEGEIPGAGLFETHQGHGDQIGPQAASGARAKPRASGDLAPRGMTVRRPSPAGIDLSLSRQFYQSGPRRK